MERQTSRGAGAMSPAEMPEELAGPVQPAPRASSDWRGVTYVLKRAGPLAAWVVAGVCGWNLRSRVDLLEAVLRGGGVWLAVLALWMGGISLAERLLDCGAGHDSRVAGHGSDHSVPTRDS